MQTSHANATSPQLALIAAISIPLLSLLALALGGGANFASWAITGFPNALFPAAAATLLYLAPGMALLRLGWKGSLPLAERLALALSASVALPPLLLLLSGIVGLRWGPGLVWVYAIAATLVAAWPLHQPEVWRARLRLPSPEAALLVGLTLAALVVRIYAIRALPAPLWNDGYQHTLMAQLIADHGGLFQSWRPYAVLRTFTYHFGFQANVAMFHWMTGTTVIGSSLLVGQILNAAAVPLAYLLTERMGGGRSAGLWAAILVGCVSLMPGYYLNWGRYTQLAGQTALVAVCVCWAALLEQDRRDWRLAALCGVLSGCLAITHYRVAAFAGCFVAAYGIWAMAMSALPLRRRLGLALTHAAVAAALALLLTLSWWLNIASGYLIDGALLFLRPTAEQAAMAATHNAWGAITPFYVKPYVLLGSFIGLLAAAWQRQWRLLALALWAGIVLLITNPAAVGLGGGGIITNFAVFIAAYIVVLPLCGYAIAVALGLLPALARTPLTALAALALLGWSVGWQSDIADRQFQLLGPEDAAAMGWVRDHTPPDARFLIDSAVAYSGSSAIGIDGGLWLPLAAQRTTTLPPLTYTSERAERPTYAWEVLPFIQNLRDQGLGSSASLAALRADGVGYVYLGPHRNPDYQGWIDLAQLQGSPAWQQVYNRDGVQIFQLNAGR